MASAVKLDSYCEALAVFTALPHAYFCFEVLSGFFIIDHGF